MMKSNPGQDRFTRRQFIIAGLCVGGAAVAGAGILLGRTRGKGTSIAVFRNPAYHKRVDSSGPVLECQKGNGEIIAFRMDQPAALFWEKVPTAEAFATEGKKITIDEIIAAIAPGFERQVASEWRRDARAFAQEALRQGVLLAEGARVRVEYTPPLNRK